MDLKLFYYRVTKCSLKTYLEPCQIFLMELFAKMSNGFELWTILGKAQSYMFDRILNVVRCAIRYHVYNFKKVKNTHGGSLQLY